MPERISDAPWLFWLLEGLHRAQAGLLQLLYALGLVHAVDGQPAWPWAQRMAGENLLLDLGLARQLLWSLVAMVLAVTLLLLACGWRRGRPWLLLGALAVVLLASWPQSRLVLAPAVPSSFHRNPLPFSDAAIVQGAGHYQRLCLHCHGAAGNGQGADAGRQPIWPPSFVGPLLWRRADGELLHAVRHGLQDHQGRQTMPGFATQLTLEQSWALLHFLRAQAAGELLRASGNWGQPIALPDMPLRCHRPDKQQVSDWQGQRLRLVSAAHPQDLLPDPRMVTLWLPPPGQGRGAVPDQVDCVITSGAVAQQALGWVQAGDSEALGNVQLLADKAGWLRARNNRDAESWSDEDLLCRTTDSTAAPADVAEDGLTRILRRMDMEPLGYVRGGRVHQ
ncbi:MAG: cytochrome c [Comamonas sp.]|jgi:mono/diheme cytochrome c family protein|nr:cytochrome c [Comamonas sp.]